MSKYRQWYDQIVGRGQTRRSLGGYSEVHHILPRSLGGGDEPSNLVKLTYREHFLAHWLLTKIYDGAARSAMVYALHCMSMAIGGRTIVGWQVETAKRAIKDESRRYRRLRIERWRERHRQTASHTHNVLGKAHSAGRELKLSRGPDRQQLRGYATAIIASRSTKRLRKNPGKNLQSLYEFSGKRYVPKGNKEFTHGRPRKRNDMIGPPKSLRQLFKS